MVPSSEVRNWISSPVAAARYIKLGCQTRCQIYSVCGISVASITEPIIRSKASHVPAKHPPKCNGFDGKKASCRIINLAVLRMAGRVYFIFLSRFFGPKKKKKEKERKKENREKGEDDLTRMSILPSSPNIKGNMRPKVPYVVTAWKFNAITEICIPSERAHHIHYIILKSGQFIFSPSYFDFKGHQLVGLHMMAISFGPRWWMMNQYGIVLNTLQPASSGNKHILGQTTLIDEHSHKDMIVLLCVL